MRLLKIILIALLVVLVVGAVLTCFVGGGDNSLKNIISNWINANDIEYATVVFKDRYLINSETIVTTIAEIKVIEGDTLKGRFPPEPAHPYSDKMCYVGFAGWYYGSIKVTEDFVVNHPITLYSSYDFDHSYISNGTEYHDYEIGGHLVRPYVCKYCGFERKELYHIFEKGELPEYVDEFGHNVYAIGCVFSGCSYDKNFSERLRTYVEHNYENGICTLCGEEQGHQHSWNGDNVCRTCGKIKNEEINLLHFCNHVCDVCNKCTDKLCLNEVCLDKCLGHNAPTPEHVCNHVCEDCGKCKDATCTDSACSAKCQGHDEPVPEHICNHVCDVCSKCTDLACENEICGDKCDGHDEPVPEHTCCHVCEVCGLCTDETCENEICTDKCQGHHICSNLCETCGNCTDLTCEDEVCSNKCQGHNAPIPEHVCSHVCDVCNKCTDLTCINEVCADKCNGHDEPVPEHTCCHVCEVCGNCTDLACEDEVCANKCNGHHVCSSICDTCGLCTDLACEDEVCADKCNGHHECSHVCETCNKCTDLTCENSFCAEKCAGHHVCSSICDTCGKCTDTTCLDTVCSDKCGGHHVCNHVCEVCGLCTDLTCEYEVCADKCNGHHECSSLCDICNKCTDLACEDEVCANKCNGHHVCSSICDTCGKCTDTTCLDTVCSDKCGGHHICQHVCSTCGKCKDATCTNSVCSVKCQGHVHHCMSVCVTCRKCQNINCDEPACGEKCRGHADEYSALFHDSYDLVTGGDVVSEAFILPQYEEFEEQLWQLEGPSFGGMSTNEIEQSSLVLKGLTLYDFMEKTFAMKAEINVTYPSAYIYSQYRTEVKIRSTSPELDGQYADSYACVVSLTIVNANHYPFPISAVMLNINGTFLGNYRGDTDKLAYYSYLSQDYLNRCAEARLFFRSESLFMDFLKSREKIWFRVSVPAIFGGSIKSTRTSSEFKEAFGNFISFEGRNPIYNTVADFGNGVNRLLFGYDVWSQKLYVSLIDVHYYLRRNLNIKFIDKYGSDLQYEQGGEIIDCPWYSFSVAPVNNKLSASTVEKTGREEKVLSYLLWSVDNYIALYPKN